jgi:hypothetical protein
MESEEPLIRFLTDGRIHEPTGRHAGEFIFVFGKLITDPTALPPAALVVPFSGELVRPDGTRVLADDAHVDYPVADEALDEGPFVLLRGLHAAEVPAGTLIVSRRSGSPPADAAGGR